jgi:LacI family transcriptional regulator, galactose operon repressor
MVTLADVARHAQVAQSTVHYVLSGKRPISAATRQRVETAIEELGYHPHAGARALASRRSSVLALVHPLRPELRLPLRMVLSVVTSARGYAHDVLLLTGDEGPAGMRRVARSSLVDGFVLMDVELRDERVGVLRELELPGVLIGVPERTDGLTCVDLDFEAAAAMCVDHLAELGHREIVLVGEAAEVYRRGSGFANRSLAGFTRRAAELGLSASHHTCDGSPEQVEAPLAAHPDATAFIVHNAIALRPLLDALRVRGRDVPWDVSVVSLAPDELGQAGAVTTVPLPSEEMGRRAVELLMGKLDGAPDSGATLLAPELALRGSTAPR